MTDVYTRGLNSPTPLLMLKIQLELSICIAAPRESSSDDREAELAQFLTWEDGRDWRQDPKIYPWANTKTWARLDVRYLGNFKASNGEAYDLSIRIVDRPDLLVDCSVYIDNGAEYGSVALSAYHFTKTEVGREIWRRAAMIDLV